MAARRHLVKHLVAIPDLTLATLCRGLESRFGFKGHGTNLRREVAAWENNRNASNVAVDWQFSTSNARIKLKHLYPRIQP